MCHLEKTLKPELPSTGQWLHGNHCCLLPKGFRGNSTQDNQLYCTLTPPPHPEIPKFFNFHTSVVFFLLESWLVCAAWLAHKRSLVGLHSSSPPSPPTKSVLPMIWHSYSSSYMYTYSVKNVSFGFWLLKSRNIWEGDKNGIRGRESEKLEMEGKS